MKHYVTVYGVVSPTTLSTGYLDEIIPVGPYDFEPFIPGKQVICLFGVEDEASEELLKTGLDYMATRTSDSLAKILMKDLANQGYAYYKEHMPIGIGEALKCEWDAETDAIVEATEVLSAIMDVSVLQSFFGELYIMGINAGIRYAEHHPAPAMVN